VVLVLRNLSVAHEVLPFGFAVVGKVEHVEHVGLFLLDHLPAEVDDVLQSQSLMIFLPAVAYQDGIRLGKGVELEL
jgi:hypothetical protein